MESIHLAVVESSTDHSLLSDVESSSDVHVAGFNTQQSVRQELSAQSLYGGGLNRRSTETVVQR